MVRAGLTAAVALLAVAGLQAADMLPASRLTLPLWQMFICSLLAALAQAVLAEAEQVLMAHHLLNLQEHQELQTQAVEEVVEVTGQLQVLLKHLAALAL